MFGDIIVSLWDAFCMAVWPFFFFLPLPLFVCDSARFNGLKKAKVCRDKIGRLFLLCVYPLSEEQKIGENPLKTLVFCSKWRQVSLTSTIATKKCFSIPQSLPMTLTSHYPRNSPHKTFFILCDVMSLPLPLLFSIMQESIWGTPPTTVRELIVWENQLTYAGQHIAENGMQRKAQMWSL